MDSESDAYTTKMQRNRMMNLLGNVTASNTGTQLLYASAPLGGMTYTAANLTTT